jgi:hypothetical protein
VEQVSKAVVSTLRDKKLREEAKPLNWAILNERAERAKVRAKVMSFYQALQPKRNS